MDWNAVEISLPQEKLDILSAQLMAWGSVGLEEKPIHNGTARVIAYFPGGNDMWKPALQEMINNFGGKYAISNVLPEDWATSWRQNFPPQEIVPGITIMPSWENKKPDDKIIVLDPGMAFGTGTHQTTRLCAKAIYDLLKLWGQHGDHLGQVSSQKNNYEAETRPLDKINFLDLGCGSGILSIVANRLGISKITAVDIDEDSVIICSDNFRTNLVKAKTFNKTPNDKYDIIVANILLNPLMELSNLITSSLNQNGTLILSGITEDQKEELSKSYNQFKLIKSYQDDEWMALVMEKCL